MEDCNHSFIVPVQSPFLPDISLMPIEMVFLQIVHTTGTLVGLGIVCWGIVASIRARNGRVARGGVAPASLQPIEDRLTRLEQSTESIALQVERIAEGQRFVTKLLSDGARTPARLPTSEL